ncbi:MAG: hypothetical protein AB8B50_05605 [Pirellulaceae bacterium]
MKLPTNDTAKRLGATTRHSPLAPMLFGFLLGFCLAFQPTSCTLAQEPLRERVQSDRAAKPVTRLPDNVRVENSSAPRWNKVVLLARPRIASGDVEALLKSIRDTVSMFVLSILATVSEETNPLTGEKLFKLAEVGVGYSAFVDKELYTVSSANFKQLGLQLGIIGRQLVKNNDAQLETTRVVARTSNVFVFDVPSLMLRGRTHEDFVTRHFIWVDSKTGRLSTLVWLLGTDGSVVTSEAIRGFPDGLKEDRKIHVDGDAFLLGGIPTERAFALESLPPGQQLNWTVEAKQLAGLPAYSRQELQGLANALNECLRRTKATATASP